MNIATSIRTVPIDHFVGELRKFSQDAFNETEPIRRFLASNPVAAETLRPYLTWNSQHYTRNLIDKTPLYELLTICWEIGQVSSVHNHRDQNCWMAVPTGRLLVENYKVVNEDIEAGTCKLIPTDTVEMNLSDPCAVDPKEPVHRVLNPRHFNQRAVSLHVYSRPFDSCVVYSPENGTCGEIKLRYNTRFGEAVLE